MRRQERGVSQVVFGFLPEQTVDLGGSIWKVTRWPEPRHLQVDQQVVRSEILRAAYRFIDAGADGDLGSRLHSGVDIEVVTPSVHGGVEVEPFPKVYRCRQCGRLRRSNEHDCRCGEHSWSQIQIVAFHSCGRLAEPFFTKCQTHDDVSVNQPGSANTRDLRFTCPVCTTLLHRNFRFVNCDCRDGTVMEHNVHRAGTVYAPQIAVMVNPPSAEVAGRFRAGAASGQTLDWVLDGMAEADPLQRGLTMEGMEQAFIASGIPPEVARTMAAAAAGQSGGAVRSEGPRLDLPDDVRSAAEESAIRLAYATGGGRMTFADLMRDARPGALIKYETAYPAVVASGGISRVDLLENFPVLTAVYGYTRADKRSALARLNWFRAEGGGVRLHALRANTEALLFTLRPTIVAQWLHAKELLANVPDDEREARMAILRVATIPKPGEVVEHETPGSELLRLVHSYSHRVIRNIASFAGIDRDSLSEYLVPLHLGFIVYAQARGDFVLGGLQALFENDLHTALAQCISGEARCALDPGCSQHGAACMACLHVGEPSCRYFNGFLSRENLFGVDGFIRLAAAPVNSNTS